MKIGFLVLCHTDPQHIGRLAARLCRTEAFSLWIHVDAKVDMQPFAQAVSGLPRVRLIPEREDCRWGRFGAVRALLGLMDAAVHAGCDRLVVLQGLDYPLRSNQEILAFFQAYPKTEFLRACCVSDSQDEYLYRRCRRYWLLNDSLPAKLWNRINDIRPLYLRSGYYREKGTVYKCYWGSAQWALTGDCARMMLEFVRTHSGFVRYFRHVFPCDETFFASILYQSPYAAHTLNRGPEPEQRYLVNWRNLHYFEYDGQIRVFRAEDYGFLRERPELFVRKVCTGQSDGLLDLLDRDAAGTKVEGTETVRVESGKGAVS